MNAGPRPGDPVTLIGTGPCEDAALTAPDTGLRRPGVRLEHLELVLVTHHRLDHGGLAARQIGSSRSR